MMKQANLVFKELRNAKRNTTILSPSTSKDLINSAKDIKNVRSSKQIDVTNFMENKNQKIKHIDTKLDHHQSEISKNNQMIEELSHNFYNLKEQLEKEREVVANQERKNKLLKEEIERTNKILRVKNSKIEEGNKKIAQLEKENESYKAMISKYDQFTKTINTLRGKVAHSEELQAQLKTQVGEKDKELQRQKEKIINFDALKVKEEDLNGQVLSKDILIGNLKQALNQLQLEKNKDLNQKNAFERRIDRLQEQIDAFKLSHKGLTSTITQLQKKILQNQAQYKQLEGNLKSGDIRLKDKEKEEANLKKQCYQLKHRVDDCEIQVEEGKKLLAKKDSKIDKLTQKIKELENNMGENYKQKQRLKALEDKIGTLKRKGENLQNVYYSIVPQIQCPFGHELQNPVTIIPCGHNYCLGCKKGYQKECMQCCGKLKIEAVYRNELMDDIIGMVGGIKQVMDLLK